MFSDVVILDACVLYPAPLRDLLLRLALVDLYRPRWTDNIHEEWIRSLLARRPGLSRARLRRTRELMDRAVPDCIVHDYEGLIGSLFLPDIDDRHVVAAAIQAQAGTIVTYNLRDFPEEAISEYGIRALHPDKFVARLFEFAPASVLHAVRDQRRALKNPPVSAEELLKVFLGLGLGLTVSHLEKRTGLL